MKHTQLLASTAIGAVLGAMIFGATPAKSDWIGDSILASIQSIQTAASAALSAISSSVASITSQLGATGPLALILQNGFNQNANYVQAHVVAQQQLADANNTAMAQFALNKRSAQIRDEQTPNPIHCNALDNGQTATVASGQSTQVQRSLDNSKAARTQGLNGTPAYYGSGQAIQANNNHHFASYCNGDESAAGLCSTSSMPNADQAATSLFNTTNTYPDQTTISAANDYAMTLIEPIVPAALRGDQMTTVAGQEGLAKRREYSARMALAHMIADYVVSTQTQSVSLSAAQQQEMTNMGMVPQPNGSWLQALTLDVNRRYSDINYASQLQAMPPASVEREIALELATSNYLALQNYRVALYNITVNAAHLAHDVEHAYNPIVPVSTPTMGN